MWSIRQFRKSWNTMQAVRRGREGVAAVEFGLIALPFLYLLFAILETGYILYISVMLHDAAAEGARQVRTGEVQQAATPAPQFRDAICHDVFILVRSCNDIVYEVSTVADFQSIAPTTPPTSQASASFVTGNPGDVMVVRVTYRWNFLTPFLENLLGAGAGGIRHLVSSVAFRNEPYPVP